VGRGFFLSRRRSLTGVCFISFLFLLCTMRSRVKRRFFVGRVFLVGVGWIWARSAGKKKNRTHTGTGFPGLQFSSFKSGVTFLLGMALVMFILFHSVWRATFVQQSYRHHMEHRSSTSHLLVASVGQITFFGASPFLFGMSLGRSGILQLSSDIYTLYLSFISPSLFYCPTSIRARAFSILVIIKCGFC